MSDAVWRRDEIESPCVQICMIHPGADICVGCYRTADEIAAWSRLSSEERSRIMTELPTRAESLRAPDARPSARPSARRRRRARGGASDVEL